MCDVDVVYVGLTLDGVTFSQRINEPRIDITASFDRFQALLVNAAVTIVPPSAPIHLVIKDEHWRQRGNEVHVECIKHAYSLDEAALRAPLQMQDALEKALALMVLALLSFRKHEWLVEKEETVDDSKIEGIHITIDPDTLVEGWMDDRYDGLPPERIVDTQASAERLAELVYNELHTWYPEVLTIVELPAGAFRGNNNRFHVYVQGSDDDNPDICFSALAKQDEIKQQISDLFTDFANAAETWVVEYEIVHLFIDSSDDDSRDYDTWEALFRAVGVDLAKAGFNIWDDPEWHETDEGVMAYLPIEEAHDVQHVVAGRCACYYLATRWKRGRSLVRIPSIPPA